MCVVIVVTDSHAHVALYVVGHGDRDSQTKNRMGNAESVNVAVAAEDFTRHASGDQASYQKYRIGNMREAEKPSAQ